MMAASPPPQFFTAAALGPTPQQLQLTVLALQQ
eukprot:SAG31_NODE_21650_length_544_cov_1.069663_1_plen_32_part_10